MDSFNLSHEWAPHSWLISVESCQSLVSKESHIHNILHLKHERAPHLHPWLISFESWKDPSSTSMTHFIWVMKEPLIRIQASNEMSQERAHHSWHTSFGPHIHNSCHLSMTQIKWVMDVTPFIRVMHQCLLSNESYIHEVIHPWLISYESWKSPASIAQFIWAPVISSAYVVGTMFGLQLTLRSDTPPLFQNPDNCYRILSNISSECAVGTLFGLQLALRSGHLTSRSKLSCLLK